MITHLCRSRRSRATGQAALLIGLLTLAMGCVQSPPEHSARLTKAAGLARVSIVCPKDLWEETKPSDRATNDVKATTSAIAAGPQAGRGLVRVTMTGTNLVAYLKELDANAHPSKMNGERENTAASRRVYDALAPAIDRIKAASGPTDPEPEIIIDDTIPDKT
ncbi:hypothetical protein [Streptomyces sp. NPDC057939]|uniref:hypothetical protein n=1 Tax=Streptomyces sp. NPDC057939 TaxID=3346284 RepID=UPI0036EF8E93